MDKNMIHIDELVRQKLGGAEEKERSGAWLRMRDLLDKEMPVQAPAAAFNWRRIYSAAAGLVLLASVAGGGYMAYNSFRSDSIRPEGGAGSGNLADNNGGPNSGASTTPALPQETIVTVYKKEGSSDEELIINRPVSPSAATAASGTDRNRRAANPAQTGAGSQPAILNDNTNNSGNHAIADNNIPATTSPSTPLSPNSAADVAVVSGQPAASSGAQSPATANPSRVPASVQPATQEPVLASASGSSAASHGANRANGRTNSKAKDATNPSQPANNLREVSSGVPAAIAGNQRRLAQQTDSQGFTRIRDTFQKITIRKSFVLNPATRTGRYISDTLSIERVSMEKWVPSASADPAILAAKSKGLQVNNDMVPLSNLKVKSRKASTWDAQSFKDIVRDAKSNLATIRFYPGLTGGINASLLGPSGLTGFQLGVSGLFTFGEKWSAAGEVKYFQRFNGNSLDDSYFKFEPIPNSSDYTKTTVERNFKFSNTQSVEVPLSVRYALGRLHMFTGINMVYNLRINTELFDRQYDEKTVNVTEFASRIDDKPLIGLSDFDARFTGGYLLGVGYQWSPAFSLDLRMTQNVWNSKKGTGAQLVYDQLYKTPSFQISVGYRFSNNPRFPKAR